MPAKVIEVEGLGPVHFFKRRGSSKIRLSITAKGQVRVSLPFWTTYKTAAIFVARQKDWILDKKPLVGALPQGARIGRRHRLVYRRGTGRVVKARLDTPDIIVTLPAGSEPTAPDVIAATEKVCVRALKAEAQALLPGRLQALARQHGFDYGRVNVKQLTGRWGSCDSQGNITLNCFLMQLPDNLIDYVLLHELVHTKIMAHGTVFWTELGLHVPQLSMIRQAIKAHHPILKAS